MTPVLLDDVTDEEFRCYRGRVPAQAILLRELIDSRRAFIERLIHSVWGHDPEGGPLCAQRIIHLHIFHLRKRLRPGWRIRNIHGQAYELIHDAPIEPRPVQLRPAQLRKAA